MRYLLLEQEPAPLSAHADKGKLVTELGPRGKQDPRGWLLGPWAVTPILAR